MFYEPKGTIVIFWKKLLASKYFQNEIRFSKIIIVIEWNLTNSLNFYVFQQSTRKKCCHQSIFPTWSENFTAIHTIWLLRWGVLHRNKPHQWLQTSSHWCHCRQEQISYRTGIDHKNHCTARRCVLSVSFQVDLLLWPW